MLAYDPLYRNEEDTKDFGGGRFLTPEEIEDVVEYVLKISGQQADVVKAARGDTLFHDGAKGNCYDCHGDGMEKGNVTFDELDTARERNASSMGER